MLVLCSHLRKHCITFTNAQRVLFSVSVYNRRVPHIRPQFYNLSASPKHRGAYVQDLTREYAPHLDVGIGTYCRPIEAGSTPVCLCFSRPPETQLAEVGHSIDCGIFQALRRFVLSMCRSIDTTCEHTYNWRRIPLIAVLWTLASFLHRHSTTETLNLTVYRSFNEELPEDHVAIW